MNIITYFFILAVVTLFCGSVSSCLYSTESYRSVTVDDCKKHCAPYSVNTIQPNVYEKTIHDRFLWHKFDSVISVNLYNVCTCKP